MKNITAIGEIIFDVYPGYIKPGGAPLNFIYHIQKLTGKGTLISRVGNDPHGKEALEFLRKTNFPVSYIQVDNKLETGTALANLDKYKIPHWEIPSGRAFDFIDIPADSDKIIEDTMCFYFGSLAQRMKKSRIAIQSFFGRDIQYFFDVNIRQSYYTKEILELSLHAADVLKVNEEELFLLHNIFLQGKFDLNQSASAIMEKFNIELAALTLGDKGAWLFNSKESNFYKATANNIVDTTGAGDAYSAMLCLGYLNNMSLIKINQLASDFAAEIIKLPSAIPPEGTFYEKFKPFFSSSAYS
jgi:fructokinase